MKKILTSLLVVGVAGSVLFGASRAFFSDTETSADNTFTAGAIDLKIDNESYYNGEAWPDATWDLEDLTGHLFFNFPDLKPDDEGEDTISLHVENNDAYACMNIKMTEDDDNTCTEPENADDQTCSEPDNDTLDGELGANLNFMFWADDGDNVLEVGENIFKQGPAKTLFDGVTWTLADSVMNIWNPSASPGPLTGATTYYIGKAWCFGTLTEAELEQDGLGANSTRTPANSTGGVACDGLALNNATQTDQLLADLQFSAVQARHNENYVCRPGETPPPTDPPQACIDDADVMLVLDRSGSISNTELASLKNAATSFVTALNPSALGAHVGMSSFSTNGTLNVHLTDTAANVNTGINGLTRGGLTNLYEGLLLAGTELTNPGDGHDRVDLTSPDYLVVITDGNPNQPPNEANARAQATAQATSIKGGGATIYVVGVGNDVDSAYLQTNIASPSKYYPIDNYTDLSTVLTGIATQCPQ